MDSINLLTDFNNIYQGKKVLVTGHTGFKGSWISIWLTKLGANVVGFSLEKWNNDYIYKNSSMRNHLHANEKGDIENYDLLKEIFDKHNPDIVFHLAAQPLVRDSYENPLKTFKTNIIGTANVLECIRTTPSVKAGVIITTDKVYKDQSKKEGYNEEDELGGFDPYSSSKACCEIISKSYKDAFFKHQNKYIATVRAGNVIGGGDFAKDRIIPDCIKYLSNDKPIPIRNPSYIRPWQHVLEPTNAYLTIGQKLLEENKEFSREWNIGPDKESCQDVLTITNLLIKHYGKGEWVDISDPTEKKKETQLLKLNNNLLKTTGWKPILNLDNTIKWTVSWYKEMNYNDPFELCSKQIEDYYKLKKN